MPKFALLVRRATPAGGEAIKDSVVEDTYQALVALGHSESDARQLIEQALASGSKFKDVEAMIQGIYKKQFGG
jgi:Holliday junction DNA helicase RuvA